MNPDLKIAQKAILEPIAAIAEKLGVPYSELEPYGKYKAKLPLSLLKTASGRQGKLILVTALSPTPAGEGKTTVSIGLSEGMNKLGKKTTVVLREPSLGPVFGMKGGAAGGGYSQVVPMEDINLHFTGDFSAITKANNLLAAMIDNHLYYDHEPKLDPRRILWRRVIDMNDRALRNINIGLNGPLNGVPREEGYYITPASEIMAILCLASDFKDLKERLGNILVGFQRDLSPVYARDIKAVGAMAVLLRDALNPNLVQTLEGNPAILHGGPFANIAQGTNSVVATKMGLALSDYVVTEAGFGADLGAEKFFDIKCASSQLKPAATLIVATIQALRYHGDVGLKELKDPNTDAVKKGFANLKQHIENMRKFKIEPIVAINAFPWDTSEEHELVKTLCEEMNVSAIVSDGWAKGSAGTLELAKEVARIADNDPGLFSPLYASQDSITDKIEKIATEIYRATNVEYEPKAQADLRRIDRLGLSHLPVCIAKTQKSFSDDELVRGAPQGHTLHVREIEIAAGAGFVIPITGKMMRMPGLPKEPAAYFMDVDDNGVISGLS